MADESTPTPTTPAKDFFSTYANSVRFELQSLDLRIVFGQTRQNRPTEVQGEGVMSWPEAKLMAHLMSVNIAIYENVSGNIAIPPEMVPKPPPALKDDGDTIARGIHAATTRLYQQLIDSLKS